MIKEGVWMLCSIIIDYGICVGVLGCEVDGMLGDCDVLLVVVEECN